VMYADNRHTSWRRLPVGSHLSAHALGDPDREDGREKPVIR
jgi:hypothetical protein